jgi:hypothetical protein
MASLIMAVVVNNLREAQISVSNVKANCNASIIFQKNRRQSSYMVPAACTV